MSRINYEIGKASQYQRRLSFRHDGTAYNAYSDKLQDYIQLKLRLHRLRKSCYFPFDAYAEKEDIDAILEKCKQLRREIKEARANAGALVWGDLEPVPIAAGEQGTRVAGLDRKTIPCASTEGCLENAGRWYRGFAYCTQHFEYERHRVKQERRDLQRERQEKNRAERERTYAQWRLEAEANKRRAEEEDKLKYEQTFGWLDRPESLPTAQFSHAGSRDSAMELGTCGEPGCDRQDQHIHEFGLQNKC